MSVNVNQIFVFDKFKHTDEGLKYFIGYQEGEIVKLLWIIVLPQMSGYIKHFESGSKKMSFLLKMIKCGKNKMKFGIRLKIN